MSPKTARLVRRWIWIGVGIWIVATILGLETQRTIQHYFQSGPLLSRAELLLPALLRGLLFAGAAACVGFLCHLGLGRLAGARRPAPPGHCESCLYDLKGLKSAVCPECGADLPQPRQRRAASR